MELLSSFNLLIVPVTEAFFVNWVSDLILVDSLDKMSPECLSELEKELEVFHITRLVVITVDLLKWLDFFMVVSMMSVMLSMMPMMLSMVWEQHVCEPTGFSLRCKSKSCENEFHIK